jgi:hypothetical protein
MPKKRDYQAEYKYHGKPEQIANRASRNAARAKVEKQVGKAAVKGRDVDHKDGNPKNNSAKNLRVESVAKNRGRK